MKQPYIAGLFFIPTLLFANGFEEAWQLSDGEIQTIETGKMVVRTASAGAGYAKKVEAFLVIQASPEAVFDLIIDYPKLPVFMPNLDKIEVLESDSTGAVVNYYLALPFGVKKKYRLQLSYDTTPPDLRLTWQSLPWQGLKPEETVKYTEGYWSLKAKGNQETLLHYYTKTDPGHVPLGLGWIVDYLTKESIVGLLENTKTKTESQ